MRSGALKRFVPEIPHVSADTKKAFQRTGVTYSMRGLDDHRTGCAGCLFTIQPRGIRAYFLDSHMDGSLLSDGAG